MREQFNLLPVQRDDSDLFLLDPATNKGLSELVHYLGFDFILYEVSDTSLIGRNLVCVHEHGFDSATASVICSTRSGGGKTIPSADQELKPARNPITLIARFDVKVINEAVARYLQRPPRDFLRPAYQLSFVSEPVGYMHDILIHPVLLGEIDNTIHVFIREKAEERGIESCFLCGSVSDQWRELVVIANEDKLVRESQWAETGGERNLRSLVDDAIVELASGEQSAMTYCIRCLQELMKFIVLYLLVN